MALQLGPASVWAGDRLVPSSPQGRLPGDAPSPRGCIPGEALSPRGRFPGDIEQRGGFALHLHFPPRPYLLG
eukprot:CAMPEP_0194708826 /NCGR_PEP_ID=MMETSP0296-20130528/1672_1 /TAXON_ID=39354 /ORGANISM="Heterosigma akashiwo, Strain CCMP2393" /LENGTH=71 /DNA_ID=CAMNT_0039605789 /DNA_START=1751 /DNA_END=1966 /DNA_ORIENTATION=-